MPQQAHAVIDLKFAICDDQKQHIDDVACALKNYLAKINEQNFIVEEFINPFDLLDKMDSGTPFDVIFLDVLMPPIDGVDTAKEIRMKKYPCEIVFITSSEDYALDAFDVGAVHYILKPIKSAHFDEAMDRLFKKIFSNVEKYVVFRTSSGGMEKSRNFFYRVY